MEQVREARDQAQEEAWEEAAVAWAKDVVAKGEEVVSVQARAVIACAPTVAKNQHINWGAPVISCNVQSVERP